MSLLFWGIVSVVPLYHISQEIKKKEQQKILLELLYRDHLRCIERKGFTNTYTNPKVKYEAIVGNKSVDELESCKSTYFAFLSAYYKDQF